MNNTTYDCSALSTTAVVIGGIIAIAIWVVFLLAYVKIISKAGYSGWWVLIMFVPIVNIIMLLVFAYKEWPIQRELRELRGWANQIQRGGRDGQPGSGPRTGRTGSTELIAHGAVSRATCSTKIAVPGNISPRSGDH